MTKTISGIKKNHNHFLNLKTYLRGTQVIF